MELYRRMNMALSHYMTDQFTPGLNENSDRKHVPFKAFALLVPSHKDGKRFVYYRDMEKAANIIEADLINAGINIAQPVAFTPQFGQTPARVTIYGFIEIDRTRSPNSPPTTYPHLIHSGTDPGQKTSVVSGPTGGSVSWGQSVHERIDEEVAWLKNALESASERISSIFFIDYNGVKYGAEFKRRYRSFPHT
jgi:hypothetical protein